MPNDSLAANGTAIGCVNVTWRSSRPGGCPGRPGKLSRYKPGMAQFLQIPAKDKIVMVAVICPEPEVTVGYRFLEGYLSI